MTKNIVIHNFRSAEKCPQANAGLNTFALSQRTREADVSNEILLAEGGVFLSAAGASDQQAESRLEPALDSGDHAGVTVRNESSAGAHFPRVRSGLSETQNASGAEGAKKSLHWALQHPKTSAT